jgi:hypothetical protein
MKAPLKAEMKSLAIAMVSVVLLGAVAQGQTVDPLSSVSGVRVEVVDGKPR